MSDYCWQAGFFIRLVAADVLDGGETDEVGLPCCLVLAFTQDLCMVSQLQMIGACPGFLVLACFGLFGIRISVPCAAIKA